MKIKYLILIVIIALFSCKNNIDHEKESLLSKKVELKYAQGFEIFDYSNYQVINIKNPWQGAEGINYKFILASDLKNLPTNLNSFTIIKTPVNRVVCMSTTHIAFIDLLNRTNSIVGISGADYVNNQKVRDAIDNNKIPDVGYDSNLNYELIASLNPDLVITYGVSGQVSGYNQKLNELGIKTIINGEYLENHPLGKLEWIKLFGYLFNDPELAKNYFENAEKDYNQLLDATKDVTSKPVVIFGLPYKDVWYVPGGNSYLAKMVAHAGGQYLWSKNDSRESLPFNLESIFIEADNADIWLNTGTVNSKEDILKMDERFSSFNPFKKGQIFNNNRLINDYGGNDYWEQGIVEPQVILKDMIKIIHPDLLPNHELVYYKPIE